MHKYNLPQADFYERGVSFITILKRPKLIGQVSDELEKTSQKISGNECDHAGIKLEKMFAAEFLSQYNSKPVVIKVVYVL